jgi:two-component system chemotaxis response regulator CheB
MPHAKHRAIRVVVVDDSPTARGLLVSLLNSTDGMQVIGTGASGEEALQLAKRLKPDVMTLDVNMKGMDGFAATRLIMRESPLPIILVTSSMMPNETNLTFQALNAGALTVVRKPGLADPDTCDRLVQTVQVMAGVPVIHHWGRHNATASLAAAQAVRARRSNEAQPKVDQLKMIGVAASTGGPAALAAVFRPLPASFPWPILVVQHISLGFGMGLVQWIDTQTALQTRMAEHGEVPRAGTILFAPDDYHMQVNARGEVELVKGQPFKGLRPSANPLFQSMASVYNANALGIMLTGMGDDGAEGMSALYLAGGFTIAQDEESSVIYGMPRAVIERQVVSQTLPLDEIGPTLASYAAAKICEAVNE